MSQLVNWWVAVPTTAAAVVSAWFIGQTYRVYRRIHETMEQANRILEETNRISVAVARQAQQNYEHAHAPRVTITFDRPGDGNREKKDRYARWKLENKGRGDAFDLSIFSLDGTEWQAHKRGAKCQRQRLEPGQEHAEILEHGRQAGSRELKAARLRVIAVYFDEFGNRWETTFENGRSGEPKRIAATDRPSQTRD